MLGSLTNVPVPVEVYKMHLDLLKSTQMFLLIFHLLLGRLTRFRVPEFKSPYCMDHTGIFVSTPV